LYRSVEQENASCFVYLRQYHNQCYLVTLNFSAQDQTVTLPALGQGRIVLSTSMNRGGTLDLSETHLHNNEGLLIDVDISS
jgi:alpha-glucosidase